MTIHEVKPMSDRVKESVRLCKQILDLGISENDPSYLQVKTYLNEWIKSDEKKVKDYDISFVRYARKGILTLPWRADKTCEFFLKKPNGF